MTSVELRLVHVGIWYVKSEWRRVGGSLLCLGLGCWPNSFRMARRTVRCCQPRCMRGSDLPITQCGTLVRVHFIITIPLLSYDESTITMPCPGSIIPFKSTQITKIYHESSSIRSVMHFTGSPYTRTK